MAGFQAGRSAHLWGKRSGPSCSFFWGAVVPGWSARGDERHECNETAGDEVERAIQAEGSLKYMNDPTGAVEVIARMCAPERANRYATLAEAKEDLAICES